MSKGNTFENDLLKLIFNATPIANLADNAAAAPLTDLYVSLHSADPGEAGDQTTNEVNTTQYQNYVRVARGRDTDGWTVTNNSVSPGAADGDIVFAQAGAASTGVTATHWAVGTAASGTGKVLYKGAISPNIAIANGVTPTLTQASAITED